MPYPRNVFALFLIIAASMLMAPSASAVQVITDDISIEDTTPALIFNDTTELDAQYEWYIRGWDEYFSIVDVSDGRNVLGIVPGRLSIAIGYGSSAGDQDALAFGNGASASGDWRRRPSSKASLSGTTQGPETFKALPWVQLPVRGGSGALRSVTRQQRITNRRLHWDNRPRRGVFRAPRWAFAPTQIWKGRLPSVIFACVGGGSNAIGIFHEFIEDADVGANTEVPDSASWPGPMAGTARRSAHWRSRLIRTQSFWARFRP